jgi:hypothetical protein
VDLQTNPYADLARRWLLIMSISGALMLLGYALTVVFP